MRTALSILESYANDNNGGWLYGDVHWLTAAMEEYAKQFTVIDKPKLQMLVTATCVGDIKAQVMGYYHFDGETNKHYICDDVYLKRHEIEPETMKFAKAI